jgi:valyl-tRNA synthetase
MLPDRYNFHEAEPRLAQIWSDESLYAFPQEGTSPIFTIDTPPPTVSGELHIGHCYSYTQIDVIARFQRMRGKRVFFPMGFDDNGLPTERFVEKTIQHKAQDMDLPTFIASCAQLIEQTESRLEHLWNRLSLSVDWRYRYSTISPEAQRTSQWSFIQLYQAGRAYAQPAPTLWCPECQTAIAQAEVYDSLLPTLFSTLAFQLEDGSILPIATTRPELLPACVAIFVHPDDKRYARLVGSHARIASSTFSPQAFIEVPILVDDLVDPDKGSGAVMCCTFGDSTDVRWWWKHQLPLRIALGHNGCMTDLAGELAGLSSNQARQSILKLLAAQGSILDQQSIEHNVDFHERCDTPVEYRHTRQWFIRILDQKERFIEAGRQIQWRPEYMRSRYEHWVENLQWDWCISRQRFMGVPFPVWMCRACGEIKLARLEQLPIDPRITAPDEPCVCGATDFVPEHDVMDTWATSSCSPFIIGRWTSDPAWFAQHFPASLRPQAHDIIRTWAFYTIVKSLYHTNTIPWETLMISGHVLSTRRNKISKSKAHGKIGPLALIEQESADALRYWATSVKAGQDTTFSSDILANGRRLVTKLWHACRFAERHLYDLTPEQFHAQPSLLLPSDRWLLNRLAQTISEATNELEQGDYAATRAATERFFWSDLCDNYLELVKARLYSEPGSARLAAQWTLAQALLCVLKLFAPYLPFVTEELYQGLFRVHEGAISLHLSAWPIVQPTWQDQQAEADGMLLLELLRQVRKYKAERGLSVGAELATLHIDAPPEARQFLIVATVDIKSATRACTLFFSAQPHEAETLHPLRMLDDEVGADVHSWRGSPTTPLANADDVEAVINLHRTR